MRKRIIPTLNLDNHIMRVLTVLVMICCITLGGIAPTASAESTVSTDTQAASASDAESTSTTETAEADLPAIPLTVNKVVFGNKHPYDFFNVYCQEEDVNFVSVASSKTSVATATTSYNQIVITAKKVGKTTITVTDDGGRVGTIDVTVSSSWVKANLKSTTYVSLAYGSKKINVWSKPGAKVKVKVGGKTYSVKIGKKGYKYIKISSIQKLNTKFTAQATYKGKKVIIKNKVYSNASGYMQTICSNQYTIPVMFYNLTKGDVVSITAGGKTYKKKIKKSASSTELVFKTKYQNRNYSYIDIKIKNKYGQKLYDRREYITWR